MNLPLPSLLPWLADMTLQATALVGVFWLCVLLRPNASAARHHWLLSLSLLAIPLLMLGSICSPSWQLIATSGPAEVPTLTGKLEPVDSRSFSVMAAPPLAREGSPVASPPATLQVTPQRWIALFWLGGAVCGMVCLAVSAIRLRRLRLLAEEETDERILALFRRAKSELAMRRRPIQLLRNSRCTVPMTWGLWRSIILLPAEAAHWTESRLLLVLRHELAHIQRHDSASALLTTASALLLWFHPLVWLTLGTLRQKREMACDDLAMRHSADPSDVFAADLLQAVTAGRPRCQRSPLAQTMAAADMAALKRRLAAILNEAHSRAALSRSELWRNGIVIMIAAYLLSGACGCRKAPQVAAADTQHVFLLSDTQWRNLARGDGKDVKRTELEIRNRLLEEGIQFITHPNKESLFLKDERTMEVSVDEINRAKISALLARLSKQQLILFKSRVFSIPISSTVMDEFKLAMPPDKTLGMLGVLKPEQTKALMEKISATRGMDMMSTPTLTSRSGQKSTVEAMRELIYPTEFAPPQIDENKPVTPASPTHFDMRQVGIRLGLESSLIDSKRIEITATPEFTRFDGFINYGRPIVAKTKDADGKPVEVELSENKIMQPIFNTTKCSASAVIGSGETLLIGGLGLREKVSSEGAKASQFEPSRIDPKLVADLRERPYTDLLFFMVQAEVIEP